MKLGKCKQAMADLINANGGWVDGDAIFAAMDGNGDLFGYSGRPQWTVSHGHWYGHTLTCWFFSPVVMKNHHQTIISREEYYQAYPKADADGWVERIKSAQQVDVFSVVDVRFRDGCTAFGPAHVFDWSVDGGGDDIIAYRQHTQEVKPELCESVMRSIPEPEEKPTIDQLAQDYRNKIDCARRRLGKAEVASHAASYALSLLRSACKEFGLDVSPSVDAKDKLKSILKS